MEYPLPRIVELSEKKIIGIKKRMSLSENTTGLLWREFMPCRQEIVNALTTDLISMQQYPSHYFDGFDPNKQFEKWACCEVSTFEQIPQNMESAIIPAGLYAIFHYKGLSTDNRIFTNIFKEWLPNSPYTIDQRPHFELLGSAYKNNNPLSEEDICVPVEVKT